ncbi:hypothetical protein L1987_60228 [Smallanthus sonchifolius]|uniref:Uncharacterized protein n=1 Tax=Smallanthus sonchifolius TaxID=185202 RepID=A0ACB9D7W9_9ASTR|nr:hypothetical protein L1987_60228 [Smallanthus sonchifolius]
MRERGTTGDIFTLTGMVVNNGGCWSFEVEVRWKQVVVSSPVVGGDCASFMMNVVVVVVINRMRFTALLTRDKVQAHGRSGGCGRSHGRDVVAVYVSRQKWDGHTCLTMETRWRRRWWLVLARGSRDGGVCKV